jgi:hypothetical protein
LQGHRLSKPRCAPGPSSLGRSSRVRDHLTGEAERFAQSTRSRAEGWPRHAAAQFFERKRHGDETWLSESPQSYCRSAQVSLRLIPQTHPDEQYPRNRDGTEITRDAKRTSSAQSALSIALPALSSAKRMLRRGQLAVVELRLRPQRQRRKPDEELAAPARPFAPGLDDTAVDLHQALHQRQPDPQPTLRQVGREVILHE